MKNETKVYVGMDVHKDSVMIAVLPEGEREPTLVKRLSHDPRGIRRLLDRLAREYEVRACYEASGAGYVLERMIRGLGPRVRDRGAVADTASAGRAAQARPEGRRGAREAVPGGGAGDDPGADGAGGAGARPGALPGGVSARDPQVAPLHPEVPGAAGLGIPGRPELDGQAYDVAAGGFSVTRFSRPRTRSSSASTWRCCTTSWTVARSWTDRSKYWLWIRPTRRRSVAWAASKGSRQQAAMVLVTEIGDFRRFEHPGKLMAYVGLVPSEHSSGGTRRQGLDHEGGQQPGPACAGAGGVELPVSASARDGAEATPGGTATGRRRSQLEGTAPTPQGVQAAGVPEEQPDRGSGRGEGTGRVRVGAHAGERGRGGRDRSRAARRLRSIDEDSSQDAESGRSSEARQENARASYVAGARTDPRPTRPRSSQLPTNPNSAALASGQPAYIRRIHRRSEPRATSPRLMQNNETPNLTEGPSISGERGRGGRDRSRAARRLRSIDEDSSQDAESGRSSEARQENARASYVAGARTGPETHAT